MSATRPDLNSMRTLARAKRLLQQDDIRTTLQTAVAVLIAYCIMALTGLDSPSWAVFSALFVVQANVGGTIGSALWRIAGALLGAAIAVVLMNAQRDVGIDLLQRFHHLGQHDVVGIGAGTARSLDDDRQLRAGD